MPVGFAPARSPRDSKARRVPRPLSAGLTLLPVESCVTWKVVAAIHMKICRPGSGQPSWLQSESQAITRELREMVGLSLSPLVVETSSATTSCRPSVETRGNRVSPELVTAMTGGVVR